MQTITGNMRECFRYSRHTRSFDFNPASTVLNNKMTNRRPKNVPIHFLIN